ncbi:MAG: type II toxin-antitoxin system HicA family toxin [Armatimonadota bacterium]
MTAKEIIKIIEEDGWYSVNQTGAHKNFKHAVKPGKVTVPIHRGDLKKGTIKSIFKQADLA